MDAPTRGWTFLGPRFGEVTDESAEKRYTEFVDSETSVNWTIAYLDEPVGFTGIFDIDWVRRDGESGIFIGRHDLFAEGSRVKRSGSEPISHGANCGCIECTTGSRTPTADRAAPMRRLGKTNGSVSPLVLPIR